MENKVEEFTTLLQGMMTVPEYDVRFTKLFRYALELMSTELKKARKFEHGLQLSIIPKPSVLRLKTYADVLECTLKVEQNCDEFRKIHEKCPARSQRFDYPNKKQKTSSWSYRGFTAPQPQPSFQPICLTVGSLAIIEKIVRKGMYLIV